MNRRLLLIGAASAGLAVAAGAFGAHILRTRLEPSLLGSFETAARYQMYHALALCLVALLPRTRLTALAARGFVIGTVLFSGSLYVLALTGIRALGAIAPLGGLAFLTGWTALVLHAAREPATR